jgi:tRNA-dihydrouridine synthase 3
MVARGALIKPWIFREIRSGADEDPSPAERLAIYRAYVALAREHFGEDERGNRRVREFVLWHLGFWCRHVPRRQDGTYPAMQEREEQFEPRSEEEASLSRNDPLAHAWWVDRLVGGADGSAAPPPAPAQGSDRELIPEG